MIDFVICDDNKIICANLSTIVNKIMMKNSSDYNIKVFNDYNSAFFAYVNEPHPFRIYIMDIEMPSGSGIDVARFIRKNDIHAVIIFLTSHTELGSILLGDELMFLTFISKFDNYQIKVKSAVEKALEIIGQDTMLRFKDQFGIYNIPLKDIMYITKENMERRCIIKTSYAEFKIKETLNNIYEKLNDDFKYSHRSCIVNMKNIRKYDLKKNEIMFCDGTKIDLLSGVFKKEVKENVI